MKLQKMLRMQVMVLLSILLLSNHQARAHKSVGDDDDDMGAANIKKEPVGLEPIKKFEKTSTKHEIWHSFAGHDKKKRGHLIVYRNSKT